MDEYVYEYVTDDDLELPLAIAESQEELAKIIGVSSNAIRSGLSHAKRGDRSTRYRKVKVNEVD